MKITDIINDLPKKVKLNKNFTLDESFDVNTILLVKGAVVDDWGGDGEKCYKVFVTAMAQDMEHNRSIAIADWFDSGGTPTKTYYDVNRRLIDQWGNLNDVIYVMENDDCFDLIEDSDKFKIQFAINELNNLKDNLIQKINNLNLLIPSDRIGGKIEGINLAIEDIRKQLNDLNNKLKYL